MAKNLIGVEVPQGGDNFYPDGDMRKLGLSLAGMVVVPVANVTERQAVLSGLGWTPTASRPLYVHRADSFSLEMYDGVQWWTIRRFGDDSKDPRYWAVERTTQDSATPGYEGSFCGLTIPNPLSGAYEVYCIWRCSVAGSRSTVYLRLKHNGTTLEDLPCTVELSSYFTFSLTRTFYFKTNPTQFQLQLAGQSSGGSLNFMAGSRIQVRRVTDY